MCGLTGFLWADSLPEPDAALRGMADTLVHHGPDDAGVWKFQSSEAQLSVMLRDC